MRFASALLVLALSACACTSSGTSVQSQAPEKYRFPAEFEPQEAVWMAWPTYENKAGRSSADVIIAISGALAGHTKVSLLAQTEAEKRVITDAFDKARIPREHVTLHVVPHDDIWIRDMGPIFVQRSGGGHAVIDYIFNNWGFPASPSSFLGQMVHEDEVDRAIARIRSMPIVKGMVSSEGGDREFNGKGTLMATWAVEQQRNPNKSREEIEAEFNRTLGVRHFVWLPEGIAEDDATWTGPLPGNIYTPVTPGGHIDEYARFADANTILLAEVTAEEAEGDPIRKMTRDRLERAREIIEKSVDQDGKPFRLIRIPMPEPLYDTLAPGDGAYEIMKEFPYSSGVPFPKGSPVRVIVSASYLNFLISNDVIVAQKYYRDGRDKRIQEKDQAASKILEQAFPGRTVIAIDAEAVNLGGGGIHCITQQEPR